MSEFSDTRKHWVTLFPSARYALFSQLFFFSPVLSSAQCLTNNFLVLLEASPHLLVNKISSMSPTFLGRFNHTRHRLRPHWSLVSTIHNLKTSSRSPMLISKETRQLWLINPLSLLLGLVLLVYRRLWFFGASCIIIYYILNYS